MTILESLWWRFRHKIFPRKYFIGADRDARAGVTTVAHTRIDRQGVYHVDRIERIWRNGAVLNLFGDDSDKLLELIDGGAKDADKV